MATPPFMPGSISGLGAGQQQPTGVPGIPSGSASAGQPQDPNDKAKQILAALLQASQRKQMANTAVPQQVSGMTDPNAARQIGMNTGNPHAWGTQRFLAGLAGNIKNAVAKSKQDQLLKAEGDWTYLQSAMNEKFAAEQSGDQKAMQAAEMKVQAILGDPKKLKNMAKALNQDWLNPEKTTVYGEALKKVTAQQKQKDQQEQQKQQAAQGLKVTFQKLIRKAFPQKPQLDDSQREAIGKEIEAKAPVTSPGGDPKQLQEVAKTALELEQASKAARENYYPPVADENGVLRSVSKTDPRNVVTIRDSSTGQEVKGIPKGGAPKPLMNGGVPYAVARNGKVVMPGSPDWTPADQSLMDGAMIAAKEKQMLRLPPEVAAQIGDPPDPADYKKGRSDPEYGKALAAFGKRAETIKEREASATGISRAIAGNEYRPVQVMDNDGNVYWTTAKAAISGGMSSASEGVKLKPREAQMADIQVASGKTREAINGLDKPFSPEQIAKLHLAVTTPDDTVANAELTTLATQELTDKQQDFVVWVKQLNERAMSLRNVAGMGTGAQDLRNAIRDMIPGVRSGSKEMMNKQLDAFDNQVKILKSGIAHPGKPKSGDSAAKDKDPLGIL